VPARVLGTSAAFLVVMRALIGLVVVCALARGTSAVASTSAVGASAPAKIANAAEAAAGACRDVPRVDADPLAQLQRSDVALTNALKRRVPDWSPEAAVVSARRDRLLAEILDYEAIAREALGPHWDALTGDQRAAFLPLFSALTNGALIAAAERRASVTYESETISGPEATVVVVPRPAAGSRAVATRVEYKLEGRCGHWRIHDVVVDGDSLGDVYRAQFDRLFRRGTFDDLLAVMRRELRRRAPQ
jgi:phospholipid transport system substrate-binding protein